MPSVATTAKRATEDDLRATPRDGRKYELVDGEIRVSPTGARHGQVCVNLILALATCVKERGLGQVLEAGVRLVWVIDPAKAKAVAYRSLSDVSDLQAADHLDGGDVLPGFHCRLSDIL